MKFFGITGLLLISAGVLLNDKKKQNYLFIAGGILLEVYSIYIGDFIFIILQAVFTIASVYELIESSRMNASRK